eukprot:jgi/Botrbrau1/21232/Bobra.39_2s0031.1
MRWIVATSIALSLLLTVQSQPLQGSFDPTNQQQVLNAAQAWASQKNAQNNETPLQTALLNAGKILNAANDQINAQKDDPTATPETVAAGAAYRLTGAQPDQTAAVLSVAKSGLSSAVAGLPQLVQSFQQAQQNSHGAQPGLQDLFAGIQNLVGGEDTTVATQPNKDFFSVQKQQGDTPQTTPEQQRILSGQVKMLDPGEQNSNPMFPAGEPWVGRAAGSASPGFKAEYIAPSAGDDFYALSPSARAKALLYNNPDIVPGAVSFPGKGNGDALAQLAATNDLGTGPAPKSGGAHFEPLGNSFGATLTPDNPGLLSTNRDLIPGSANRAANSGAFQSYAQMKPATSGLGIPNTLPTTTVLKSQIGPDRLPITMSFGRKLLG